MTDIVRNRSGTQDLHRNAEGYPDPVAYEAIRNVEKKEFRPLVYICSPLSGNVEVNKERARKYCRFAVEQKAIPLAPHLLFPQFMDDDNPSERELAMFMNMVLLGKCLELWVFGDTISSGMGEEITRAKKKHIPIRYFTEELKEAKPV